MSLNSHPFKPNRNILKESNFKFFANYILIEFRWYFGSIRRPEAERRLMMPLNSHGSFLIRDADGRPNEYSLSSYNLYISK